MTAEELKQRGYCCGMGCKECPYLPKHQYGNTLLADNFTKEDKQFDILMSDFLEEYKN